MLVDALPSGHPFSRLMRHAGKRWAYHTSPRLQVDFSDHHSTIALRGLREAFNWADIMPRDRIIYLFSWLFTPVSLTASGCNLYSLLAYQLYSGNFGQKLGNFYRRDGCHQSIYQLHHCLACTFWRIWLNFCPASWKFRLFLRNKFR